MDLLISCGFTELSQMVCCMPLEDGVPCRSLSSERFFFSDSQRTFVCIQLYGNKLTNQCKCCINDQCQTTLGLQEDNMYLPSPLIIDSCSPCSNFLQQLFSFTLRLSEDLSRWRTFEVDVVKQPSVKASLNKKVPVLVLAMMFGRRTSSTKL